MVEGEGRTSQRQNVLERFSVKMSNMLWSSNNAHNTYPATIACTFVGGEKLGGTRRFTTCFDGVESRAADRGRRGGEVEDDEDAEEEEVEEEEEEGVALLEATTSPLAKDAMHFETLMPLPPMSMCVRST